MNEALTKMKAVPGYYFCTNPAMLAKGEYVAVQVCKDGMVHQLDRQGQRDGLLAEDKWAADTVVARTADALFGGPPPAKAAIVIDEWKAPIFERHLAQSGYAYDKGPGLSAGTLLLMVKTTNLTALEGVVRAANTEAAKTGAPQ